MNAAVLQKSPFHNNFIAKDLDFILKRSELPPDVISGANIDYAQANNLLASKIPDLLNRVGADRVAASQLLDIENLLDVPHDKPMGNWVTVSTATGDVFFTNGVLIDMTGSEPHLNGWERYKSDRMHSVSEVRHLIDASLNGEKLDFVCKTSVPPDDIGGKVVSELVSFRRPGSDQMLHMDLDYLQYFKSKLINPTFQVDVNNTVVHVFSADKRVGIIGLNTHNFPLEKYSDFEELTNAKGMVLAELMGLELGSEEEQQEEADQSEVLRDMSNPLRDDLSGIGSGVPGFDTPDPEVPVPSHLQSQPLSQESIPAKGSWQAEAAAVEKWDAQQAHEEAPKAAAAPVALPADIAARMAQLTGRAVAAPIELASAGQPEPDQGKAGALLPQSEENGLQPLAPVESVSLGVSLDGMKEPAPLELQEQIAESHDTPMDGDVHGGFSDPFHGLDDGPALDAIPVDAYMEEENDIGPPLDDVNRLASEASIEERYPLGIPANERYPDYVYKDAYGETVLPKSPQTSAVSFELGEPINARAMSTEDYKMALQVRMAGAVSEAHAKAILQQEAMSTGRNLKQSEAICEEYGQIMQMIGHEKSVDAASYALGRIFHRYAKVWDRPQAELEHQQDVVKGRMDALNKSLDPNASPSDKPQPVPSMGLHRRTNADEALVGVKSSLDSGDSAAPEDAKNFRSTTEDGKGFYADPKYMAKRACDAVDSLKPEHLLDANGDVDTKWIASFQETLTSISERLEQSEFGQHIVDALKKMMEAVRATFNSLVEMAMRVFGKAETTPAEPNKSSDAAPSM